jgi:hypothetical protein
MRYVAEVKPTLNGRFYARCNAAPNGVAEAYGATAEEAVDKLRKEIRYRLELCPCSALGDQDVVVEVRDRVTRK